MISEYFFKGYIAHLTDENMTGGHKAIQRALEMYTHAFTDITVKLDVLVESGDRIAWQRTFHAVQQNAFKGFPSFGDTIVWRDMVTSRFSEGLIAEEWIVSDLAERLLLARKQHQTDK